LELLLELAEELDQMVDNQQLKVLILQIYIQQEVELLVKMVVLGVE
jgi:hypothetical protein